MVTCRLTQLLLRPHRSGLRSSTRTALLLNARVMNVEAAVKTWRGIQTQIYSRQLTQLQTCGTVSSQNRDTISTNQGGTTIQERNISPSLSGNLQLKSVVESLELLLFADTVLMQETRSVNSRRTYSRRKRRFQLVHSQMA